MLSDPRWTYDDPSGVPDEVPVTLHLPERMLAPVQEAAARDGVTPGAWLLVDGAETSVVLDADDAAALELATVELRDTGSGHELVVAVERRRGLLGGIINIQIGGVGIGNERYRLRVSCPHGAQLAVRTASAAVRARGRFADAAVKTASGE